MTDRLEVAALVAREYEIAKAERLAQGLRYDCWDEVVFLFRDPERGATERRVQLIEGVDLVGPEAADAKFLLRFLLSALQRECAESKLPIAHFLAGWAFAYAVGPDRDLHVHFLRSGRSLGITNYALVGADGKEELFGKEVPAEAAALVYRKGWSYHLKRGGYYERHGRADAAKRHYRESLAERADLSDAWFGLANLAAIAGKAEEAVRLYGRAIVTDVPFEDLPEAYARRADALASLSRWAEAVPDFRRAIELDPENAVACHNLGVALEALGKPAEAAAAFRAYLARAPEADDREEVEAAILALGGGGPPAAPSPPDPSSPPASPAGLDAAGGPG